MQTSEKKKVNEETLDEQTHRYRGAMNWINEWEVSVEKERKDRQTIRRNELQAEIIEIDENSKPIYLSIFLPILHFTLYLITENKSAAYLQ